MPQSPSNSVFPSSDQGTIQTHHCATVAAIEVCLQFRGPPDAVHAGDMLFEKVRVQAKKTLDAVYSDDPSSEMQQHGGMGGASSDGAMGGMGYGNSKSGYGNSYGSNPNASSGYSSMGGGSLVRRMCLKHV